MTDYDDMMRDLPDDIMNDIHAYYYRDLPYLNELNRVNQVIIDYEGLVGNGLTLDANYLTADKHFNHYLPLVEKLLYVPVTVAKLILNRDCGDYKLANEGLLLLLKYDNIYSKRREKYEGIFM